MTLQKIASDPFHRLPDDLLLFILSLLLDLKSLFQCSLVCKRFSSVIPQVRSVSLNIISTNEYTERSHQDMYNLLCALRQSHTVDDSPESLKSSLQKLKLPKFLDRFSDLETIHVVYGEPSNTGVSSFPKWKVGCSTVPMIQRFAFISPTSICNDTGEQIELEDFPQGWNPFVCTMEWLCIICMLAKTHTSLSMVTIADAREWGKLILRNEQLVEIKSCVPGEKLEYMELAFYYNSVIKKVRLPISGCTMKDVTIKICTFAAESTLGQYFHNSEYDELMSWDFGDDEKIFGEAVKEILKNQWRLRTT